MCYKNLSRSIKKPKSLQINLADIFKRCIILTLIIQKESVANHQCYLNYQLKLTGNRTFGQQQKCNQNFS